MPTLRTVLLVCAFLGFYSCSAPAGGVDLTQLNHTGEACICGTPEGDFVGCHCEDCLLNGGNPFNPDCTCLPLRPKSELQLTFASFDPSGGASTRPSVEGSLVGMDEIKLAGKSKKLRGEVLADDGQSIEFKGEDGRVTTYTYDELDQRVVYLLLKGRTSKDDGPAELRLANFANEIGLFAHARRHYGYAVAADASLEGEVDDGLARLRVNAAMSEIERADVAYAEGNEKEAREHLLNVVREFPEEAAAQEALARLNDWNVERLGPEKAALMQQAGAEAWGAVEPAAKHFDAAVEKNQKALASGNRSTFRSALADCERARKELAKASRMASASELADSLATEVVALEVEIHLSLASIEVTAGAYEKALASVNAALALDPNNEKANQQRARIESARNSYSEGYRKGYNRGRAGDPGNWTYQYRPGTGIIYRNGYGMRGSYGGWSRGGGYQGVGRGYR